ncbi:MAG TPA: hypothetical protein VHE79_07170, partial [Spirochaetia bacterium]
SLFLNPAGFSRGQGEMTLGAVSSWIYSRPDALLGLAQGMIAGTSTSSDTLDFLNSQVTTGGIGAGSSLGIGYVGNGLGIGVAVMVDSYMYGATLLGAVGDLTATVGFIGGISVPFDLFGFKLHVGGDIRPMIRVHVPLTNAVALSALMSIANGGDVLAALGSANAMYGAGVGVDLGAILELGWFDVGVSVRDLAGTTFTYSSSSFSALQSSLSSQASFPSSGTAVTADTYTIPMDVAAGVSFHPDFGSLTNIVDPSIGIDLHDIVGVVAGDRSIWTALHVGTELRLLSMFTAQAGLNQGYFTVGGGVRLWIMDLDFAVFTRELGTHVGDKASSGLSFDVSFNF